MLLLQGVVCTGLLVLIELNIFAIFKRFSFFKIPPPIAAVSADADVEAEELRVKE